jgi:hypothetical protein
MVVVLAAITWIVSLGRTAIERFSAIVGARLGQRRGSSIGTVISLSTIVHVGSISMVPPSMMLPVTTTVVIIIIIIVAPVSVMMVLVVLVVLLVMLVTHFPVIGVVVVVKVADAIAIGRHLIK